MSNSYQYYLDQCAPNEYFKKDWQTYSLKDFTATFLPNVFEKKNNDWTFFDGLGLFKDFGKKDVPADVKICTLSFPEGVEASEKKSRLVDNENHIQVFAQTADNEKVVLQITKLKDFSKVTNYDLSKSLNQTIVTTSRTELSALSADGYNRMILESLKIDVDAADKESSKQGTQIAYYIWEEDSKGHIVGTVMKAYKSDYILSYPHDKFSSGYKDLEKVSTDTLSRLNVWKDKNKERRSSAFILKKGKIIQFYNYLQKRDSKEIPEKNYVMYFGVKNDKKYFGYSSNYIHLEKANILQKVEDHYHVVVHRDKGNNIISEKVYDFAGEDVTWRFMLLYNDVRSGALRNVLSDNQKEMSFFGEQKIDSWDDLYHHYPDQNVLNAAKSRISGFDTQLIEDAKGSLNEDYYSVYISQMPKMSGANLFSHIRKVKFKEFVSNSPDADFEGYNDAENKRFLTNNPESAVMRFNVWPTILGIRGQFEDLSVITSILEKNYWIFVPVKTGGDGYHPVSGSRQFGLIENGDGTGIFYTRGTDRPTTAIDWHNEKAIFEGADTLWKFVMLFFADYINKSGGKAIVNGNYISRRP